MTLAMLLFIAILFFVLTPGVLVRLPPNGSKLAVAAVHALVFALVYQLTHKAVWRALYEGFQGNMTQRQGGLPETLSPRFQGEPQRQGGLPETLTPLSLRRPYLAPPPLPKKPAPKKPAPKKPVPKKLAPAPKKKGMK